MDDIFPADPPFDEQQDAQHAQYDPDGIMPSADSLAKRRCLVGPRHDGGGYRQQEIGESPSRSEITSFFNPGLEGHRF